MKLTKKLFSIVTIAFLLVVAVSCVPFDHTHEMKEWHIIAEPTTEVEGKAERYCSCGEMEEVVLPVLTDESVWTKSVVDSTCSVHGGVHYSSEYGEVVIELPLVEHAYGDWEIVVEPTVEQEGTAERTCVFGEKDSTSVPALSNKDVWTITETVASTCSIQGHETYVSEYGSVVVVFDLVEHVYGDWTITVEPTVDKEGKAERTCSFGEKEEVSVPALSNEEVWSSSVVKEPNYNEKGSKEYTSVYGTVEVEIAKVQAPYDGKTYYTVYFDSRGSEGSYYFNELQVQTSYFKNATTFNSESYAGSTYGFPFKYPTRIEMVDSSTGEVKMYLADSEGHSDEYKAFVDMETGVIVIMDVWNERAPFVAIPSETAITEVNATASSWNKAIVINLVNGEVSKNIFVTDKEVFFGVEVENASGDALEAKAAYASQYVYVKAADGSLIAGFVNNGETLVPADGKEGTYSGEKGTLVVTGYGVLTLNGVEGTYEVASAAEYTLDVYLSGSYYEVTLAGETYECVKPMITISFNTKGIESCESVSVNKNIEYVLPVLVSETHTFKGWFTDEACTVAAGSSIVPTEETTLYALWREKVVINLVGVLEGDESTLLLGDGDVIGDCLPTYGVVESIGKIFAGWYLDETFETSLPESAEVTVDDTNITIYAKWEDLPAYYGTYYGSEIWNSSYGNSGGKTLKIDENGKMSGLKSGFITSYNPETQEIKWKTSETATTEYRFFFDAETKTIAGIYNNYDIGTDYHFLSPALEATKGKAYASFGIYSPKTPSDTSLSGYYAQFVEVVSGTVYFLYNNHIYTTPTIEDANGNTLATVAKIKASKTIVVKDGEQTLVRVGTTGSSFNSSNSSSYNKILDIYLGTYTNGEETVVLDGVGNITYGTKKGTYKATAEGSSYGFDVYLESNSEYYQLTLDGSSFTIVKPMVTYHFVTGEGHPTVEDQSYNVNIKVNTLPTVEDSGYVFKGWYTSEEYTTAVTSFTPTVETTLYAKWAEIIVVTVYCGEEVLEEREIEDGQTFVPGSYAVSGGKLIVGFYNEATFETEFDSTAAISTSTSVYAKAMEIAPAGVLSAASNGGKDKIDQSKVYPWSIEVNEEGLLNLTSTNKGVSSSESQFVVTFAKESIVTFNYSVSGENNCDYLSIRIKSAGSSSFTQKEKFGSEAGVSGSYTIKVVAGDSLALLYRKDSGVNRGTDTAVISNLQFSDGYPEATLTYVYNDGATDNSSTIVSYGAVLTAELLANPTNVRDENLYKFDAWYLDEELTQKATTSTEVTSESFVLYAGWKQKVTVSFVVPEGATPVEAIDVWTGEALTAETTKEDFIFRGWYTSNEYTTAVDLSQGVSEATTLYAKFEELPEGSAFEKAKEATVNFGNIAMWSFETTEEFQVYYVKLVAEVSGRYNISADNYHKVGGTARYPSPKFQIYESDMTTIVKTYTSLSSGKTWVSLEAGTYYITIKYRAADSDYAWGTVTDFAIETYAHDEVSEAVQYVLGSSVSLDVNDIASSNEDYILTFVATEAKTYEFAVTNDAWTSVKVYADATLKTSVAGVSNTTSSSFIFTPEVGQTYYIVITNNWNPNHTHTVTVSTAELAVIDVLATLTFSGNHNFACGNSTWTATTKYVFDNLGNVKVSSSSSDHDDYYDGCYDSYMPKFTGTYTYVVEGTTVTLTNSSNTIVFELDSAETPTKLTVVSTTVSGSSQGYFGVGTVFNKK